MATKALRRWLPVVAAVLATLGSIPAARAANVALGKPAFADANYDTAGNVNNGNLGDAWTTAGSASAPNNFVGIDLQTATVIKQLKINWSEVATGFTVEVANTVDTDPNSFNFGIGDWTTAYFRNPTDPQPTGPDVIDLSSLAGTHRYIRIQGNASDSNNWGIAEWVVSDTLLPKVSGVAKFGTTPVANAIVTLTGPAGATSSVASVRTDATGAFSFTGLEAGAYTLSGAAPGQYAPVSQPVTVAAANVTQDLTFTTVVHNTTSRLPAYGLDFIASSTKVNDSNASSGFLALPADELPTGEAVWNTATPLPTGGLLGPTMPGTLNFFFPPTADGKDNVVNALGAILPLPAAHYTAVYVLQVGVEAPFYTRATLKYADGTEEPVLTSSGNDIYQFTTGSPGWGGGNEGEDEIVAFSVDKLYNGTTGGVNNEVPPFEVYMRTIRPNPAKVLTSINFNGEVSGPGSNTLSKGVILGYSADSLDTAQATGSVAGTIKAPNGTPVKGAQVTYFGYKIITDTTGTYKFFGVVPGDAVITASKPANYAPKSLTVPVTPGQNVTGADIQFVAPIPVVTDPLSAPSIDVVSTDANISDFTPTDWMLGREYIPTGVFSPDVPGINTESAATFTHDANAPTALAFDFGDIVDTPVAPGQPGYPVGGTPNAVVLHGATFLAPPAKIFNAYFAVVGAEGGTRIEATLRY